MKRRGKKGKKPYEELKLMVGVRVKEENMPKYGRKRKVEMGRRGKELLRARHYHI